MKVYYVRIVSVVAVDDREASTREEAREIALPKFKEYIDKDIIETTTEIEYL